MNIDLTVVVAAFLSGGLLTAVFNYFANKKINDMTSIVSNTEKIREISSELLDDAEKRWDRKFSDQEKEHGEKMGKLRERLENEARQSKGELLVEIEFLKERNQDLKLQIAELGGFVQGATGDIYKRFPLERPKGD